MSSGETARKLIIFVALRASPFARSVQLRHAVSIERANTRPFRELVTIQRLARRWDTGRWARWRFLANQFHRDRQTSAPFRTGVRGSGRPGLPVWKTSHDPL